MRDLEPNYFGKKNIYNDDILGDPGQLCDASFFARFISFLPPRLSEDVMMTEVGAFAHGDRCGGFMVSALVFGSIGPGSSPGRGHFVVFLGKTLYSHNTSLFSSV